jgi:hypothetical protein
MRTVQFVIPVPAVLIVIRAKCMRSIVKHVLQKVVGTLRSPVHCILAQTWASAAPIALPVLCHPLRLTKAERPTKAHARLPGKRAVLRTMQLRVILPTTRARINWMVFAMRDSDCFDCDPCQAFTAALKQIVCGAPRRPSDLRSSARHFGSRIQLEGCPGAGYTIRGAFQFLHVERTLYRMHQDSICLSVSLHHAKAIPIPTTLTIAPCSAYVFQACMLFFFA